MIANLNAAESVLEVSVLISEREMHCRGKDVRQRQGEGDGMRVREIGGMVENRIDTNRHQMMDASCCRVLGRGEFVKYQLRAETEASSDGVTRPTSPRNGEIDRP